MDHATDRPTTEEATFRLACELAGLAHELDQLSHLAGRMAGTCRVKARRLDDDLAPAWRE